MDKASCLTGDPRHSRAESPAEKDPGLPPSEEEGRAADLQVLLDKT